MAEQEKKKSNNNIKTIFIATAAFIVGGVGGYFVKNNDAKNDIEALNEQHDKKIEILKSDQAEKNDKFKGQINTLSSQRSALQADTAAYRDTLDMQRSRIYVLAQDVKLSEQQIADLSEDYEVMQDSLNFIIKERGHMVDSQEGHIQGLIKQLDLTEDKVKELEAEVEYVKDENGTLTAVIYTLTDDSIFPIFGADERSHNEVKAFILNGEELSDKTKEEIQNNKGKTFEVAELGL